MKKIPCKEHKLAFPDMYMPEVMGITESSGKMVTKCSVCGWYVLV